MQEASDREWIKGAYCCNMEAVLSHGWGDRRGRPSIQPLCLIASAWAENPPVSVSPNSVPPELESQPTDPENKPEPGPTKKEVSWSYFGLAREGGERGLGEEEKREGQGRKIERFIHRK